MYCDWPVLQRCCFCLPLRRGVLAIAYLNFVFSGFMVGVYSYAVNTSLRPELVYHGTTSSLPAELCIFLYLLEMIFNGLLIYGAHMKIYKYVKTYYYFAICTTLTAMVLFILEMATARYIFIALFLFGFAGSLIQIYLLILVWSLLKKLEEDGLHTFENQLHRIISNRQAKVTNNGIYNPSTIPHSDIDVCVATI